MVAFMMMFSTFAFQSHIRGAYAHGDKWVTGIPGRNAVICVSNTDGSKVSRSELEMINKSFIENVKTHPYFEASGLNAHPDISKEEAHSREKGIDILIKNGCPKAAAMRSNSPEALRVSTPGMVHTYVFIASDDEIKDKSFKHKYRDMGQEYICQGTVCNSVANSIYLTRSEIADSDVLAEALLSGVGFVTQEVDIYTNGVTPDSK